ncbi:MAG: DUF1569 domain-containing protein [Sphingobacteriaceae bacterium]|nr:DUF1569 domain-containing protein [Sphingobacteriaceae bacterium]
MAYPSIYEQKTVEALAQRIGKLSKLSSANWGKMNVAQMLAHCCIPYEQIFGERNDRISGIMKFLMRYVFKKSMVNEVPYKQSLPTAPFFIMADDKDFEKEQKRLLNYIHKCQQLGADDLVKQKHQSLGMLSAIEWNNLLYKHLDHHLRQFDV